MSEVVDCCGCCILCCGCFSMCGRLCLWIPCPGSRKKAREFEENELFAQRVEMETHAPGPTPNYVQPAPRRGPIVDPVRQHRSARSGSQGGRPSNGTHGSHAPKPSLSPGNGHTAPALAPAPADNWEPPQNKRISEAPSIGPLTELPAISLDDPPSTRVGDRHSREPSSNANGTASQQPTAMTPPNTNGLGPEH